MSASAAGLQRSLGSAAELHAVVRAMKAMAAASIGQYQQAVLALDDYHRTVQLGLAAWLRQHEDGDDDGGGPAPAAPPAATLDVIVFGSDLGMAGAFNEVMRDYVHDTLAALPGEAVIWAVGERIAARLGERGHAPGRCLPLPATLPAIAPLVGQLLGELAQRRAPAAATPVYVFHHQPAAAGLYQPVCQRLLPLDLGWRRELARLPWPGRSLPEILGPVPPALTDFLSEYLFVSLFRACAASQASENASRLAAMQRAEKNIDELLQGLTHDYQRLRQDGIDEELFELVAGYAAQLP